MYTEKEIREYFNIMLKKYSKDTGTHQHLKAVAFLMFYEDPYGDNSDTLKKVLKKV